MIDPIGAKAVRIDGTYGLDPHRAAEEKDAKAQDVRAEVAGQLPTDAAEVVPSQQRLIAAAKAAEEVNLQAVEESRRLLEAGELDTPEAADRAARRILDLGL